MSTVIVRKIAAIPVRTSSEAWEVMRNLIAPDAASPARAILDRAAGAVCSAIASEVMADDPVVVHGSGPRVRLYCLYDEDAMSGEDTSEGKLPEVPTKDDWRMSVPVTEEDFKWSAEAIKACAPHITVRIAGEEVADADPNGNESRTTMRINLEGYLQP